MHVYRIAKTRYIDDLTGTGARLNGGRWNHPNTSVVYTSSTRALATVEFLVHIPPTHLPPNLSIATINIPDTIQIEELIHTNLPQNWRQYPAPKQLAEMGDAWIHSARNLAWAVPSAVIPQESNVLINPQHTDMKHISILSIEPYHFDDRLLSK
jgi:RES domain-containing protein